MKKSLYVLLISCIAFLWAAPAVAQQTLPLLFGWDPPTVNSDGTPLTDLAGYHICIHAEGNGGLGGIPDTPIPGCGIYDAYTVLDPAANSLTINWPVPFPIGTLYARLKAFDYDGNESGWSEQISLPFAVTTPPPVGAVGPGVPGNFRWR